MIRFECDTCGAVLRVEDAKAGKRGRCPACGGVIVVPVLAVSAEASPDIDFDEVVLAQPAPGDRISAPPDRSAARVSSYDFPTAPPPAAAVYATPPLPGGKACPSCSVALPPCAKICVRCGIRVPSGRPLLTSREADRDMLEMHSDEIISKISWLVPSGIFPIYSEAMGKSLPAVTWLIAILTSLISVYAWLDESFLYKCMLWPDTPAQVRAMAPPSPTADANNAASRLMEALGALPKADEPSHSGYRHYQLVTHMFLHSGIMHMVGNMVFLLVLGSRVNAKIGNLAMAPVYGLLGVIAAKAHMWSAAGGPAAPMLGASGAIMGLAGMYVILFPLQKVYMVGWMRWGIFFGFRLSRKVFAVPGILMVLFFVAFDVIYTVAQIDDGTAHWAHLGGIIAGVALALLLMASRILYCPGDLLSLAIGRFAWPLIGTPANRLK
jgi:predicted Zn finger-like uncharacterized protein